MARGHFFSQRPRRAGRMGTPVRMAGSLAERPEAHQHGVPYPRRVDQDADVPRHCGPLKKSREDRPERSARHNSVAAFEVLAHRLPGSTPKKEHVFSDSTNS
jgi:hypothetical protein